MSFVTHARTLSLLIALIAVAGCATPPATPPRPGETPPVQPQRARRATSWSFVHQPVTTTYRVQSSTVIRLEGDSVVSDTLVTAAVITLALQPSTEGLAARGTVDSYSVQSGGRVPPPSRRIILPVPFEARLGPDGALLDLVDLAPADSVRVDSGGMSDSVGGAATTPDSIASSDTSACAAALDPVAAIARELFVAVPAQLSRGTRWADSVSTTACRGGIPVTSTAARRYEVLGDTLTERGTEVRVLRTSEITISGTGQQGSRPVTISGSGTGRHHLRLDPARGQFVGASGESTARIVFEAGMRRQSLEQRATLDVRAY